MTGHGGRARAALRPLTVPFVAPFNRSPQSPARPLSLPAALRSYTKVTSTQTSRGADERDLLELQRSHGGALLRFLLRLTYGDRQRAEDLVQETLVRAWQHPEAFEAPYESIRPWLFTVGKRLAIDARRSRLARPAEVSDRLLESTAAHGDPAERSAAALDVREAVRTLSPEHRAVLVQIYFRGLSVHEAASALGIPAGTVKSRSHYALRALGRSLPGYPDGVR